VAEVAARRPPFRPWLLLLLLPVPSLGQRLPMVPWTGLPHPPWRWWQWWSLGPSCCPAYRKQRCLM
jgi:hypothetical protein